MTQYKLVNVDRTGYMGEFTHFEVYDGDVIWNDQKQGCIEVIRLGNCTKASYSRMALLFITSADNAVDYFGVHDNFEIHEGSIEVTVDDIIMSRLREIPTRASFILSDRDGVPHLTMQIDPEDLMEFMLK